MFITRHWPCLLYLHRLTSADFKIISVSLNFCCSFKDFLVNWVSNQSLNLNNHSLLHLVRYYFSDKSLFSHNYIASSRIWRDRDCSPSLIDNIVSILAMSLWLKRLLSEK